MREELWRAIDLEPTDGDDPDRRFPAACLLDLFERASERTRDEHLGLHLGISGSEKQRLGVVGFVMTNSPTLRVAIERSSRYHRLLNGALSTKLIDDAQAGAAAITFTVDPAVADRTEGLRHLYGVATTTAVCLVRNLIDPTFSPLAVDYATGRPTALEEPEKHFRAPVRYGQPVTKILFSKGLLDLPPKAADPELGRILVRHADELVAKFPVLERSWSDRVRERLVQGVRGELPPLSAVARELGLGERSLQRRLHEEGTTFAELEDGVRRELAQRYLTSSDLTLTEIGWLLGFKDNSAFHRAFRRWTGMTPARHRANATQRSGG